MTFEQRLEDGEEEKILGLDNSQWKCSEVETYKKISVVLAEWVRGKLGGDEVTQNRDGTGNWEGLLTLTFGRKIALFESMVNFNLKNV